MLKLEEQTSSFLKSIRYSVSTKIIQFMAKIYLWLNVAIRYWCNVGFFHQGSFAILKGTEGTKGSAQSSDSTEVKLKDFTGKMVGLKVSLLLCFVLLFAKDVCLKNQVDLVQKVLKLIL